MIFARKKQMRFIAMADEEEILVSDFAVLYGNIPLGL